MGNDTLRVSLYQNWLTDKWEYEVRVARASRFQWVAGSRSYDTWTQAAAAAAVAWPEIKFHETIKVEPF